MAKLKKKYSYAKRPLWQWVVFYLVIGGIIYALLYYSGLVRLRGYNPSSNQNYSTSDYNFIE